MESTRSTSGGHEPSTASTHALGDQVSRGAGWAVLANITMRMASVAVTAVLARVLSKEDFGTFAVAAAVYAIVASLAELGMASAIARSRDEPDGIAPTVVSLSILTSGTLGGAMAIWALPIATALGQPGAASSLRILSICLVLTGIFAVPGAQLMREFRQDRIFLAAVVGFAVGNPLLVLLALHGDGPEAFAWSRVVGQLATGLVLLLGTSRRYLPGWRRTEIGPLLRFGLPLSMANLVNWTLLNADYLILGRFADAALVGSYMIAFNVASWTTAVIGSALNSVVVPALGRLSGDPVEFNAAIRRAVILVAVIAFPVTAASVALAHPIVSVLFGPRWTDSAPVLAVLAAYGGLFAFTLLFANVLVALGQTARLLTIQLVWIAALVPTIIIGLRWNGLQGVALAHVITIATLIVPIYAITIGRSTSIRLDQLARPLLRLLAGAVFAGAVAFLSTIVLSWDLLQVVVGGCSAVAVYFVIAAPVIESHAPFLKRLSDVLRRREPPTPPRADCGAQTADAPPAICTVQNVARTSQDKSTESEQP